MFVFRVKKNQQRSLILLYGFKQTIFLSYCGGGEIEFANRQENRKFQLDPRQVRTKRASSLTEEGKFLHSARPKLQTIRKGAKKQWLLAIISFTQLVKWAQQSAVTWLSSYGFLSLFSEIILGTKTANEERNRISRFVHVPVSAPINQAIRSFGHGSSRWLNERDHLQWNPITSPFR